MSALDDLSILFSLVERIWNAGIVSDARRIASSARTCEVAQLKPNCLFVVPKMVSFKIHPATLYPLKAGIPGSEFTAAVHMDK